MKQYMTLFSIVLLSVASVGCSRAYQGNAEIIDAMTYGDFGVARESALQSASSDVEKRSYLLDRQKILWASIAEGDMDTAEASADYVYDQLRTQGVNSGKAFGRFLLGDSAVQVWKGEPFEQAASFLAVAIVDGSRGQWGNMRASALGSLFQIRDLSTVIEGERQQNEQAATLSDRELLVAAAARADEEDENLEDDAAFESFEGGIPLRASDYEPGYALAAIAERQLGLREEMYESSRKLRAVNPDLSGLAAQIVSGSYNTVLVIDYGLAPKKIRTGPDGAIAAYEARTPSDRDMVVVSTRSGTGRFPVLTDYNRLATSLEWNNFEDVRLAKSYIGTGLVVAGTAIALYGDSTEAQLIGAGIAIAGLISKSSAAADTRHCEALPQRTYLALLNLPAGVSDVEISIDGHPETFAVLPGLTAREDGELRFLYTRLPVYAPSEPTRTRVVYANDASWQSSEAPTLPYILGGRCVRTPSEAVLSEYRRAGLPGWVTVNDIERMYEEEGVQLPGSVGMPKGAHFLEGGNAFYTPAPGSAGFSRLFCREHPAYAPVGPTAQTILSEMYPADLGTAN